MEGDPPRFPSGSTCPMVLGYPLDSTRHAFHLQGYHLLWRAVPDPSVKRTHETSLRHEAPRRPHNLPAATRVGYHATGIWALARSLAATRAISVDFFSLRVLRCFTSPRLAPRPYFIGDGVPPHEWRRVAPFGNLRINACLRLPEAYRSLPRPSSPVRTEASTVQLLVA